MIDQASFVCFGSRQVCYIDDSKPRPQRKSTCRDIVPVVGVLLGRYSNVAVAHGSQ